MGAENGIWDFWVLSKRSIVADDEETARVRLALRDNEEVISVGSAPVLTTSPVLTVVLCSPPVENTRPDLPPFGPLEDIPEYEVGGPRKDSDRLGVGKLIRRVKRAFHLNNRDPLPVGLGGRDNDVPTSKTWDVLESEAPKNPPKLPSMMQGWDV